MANTNSVIIYQHINYAGNSKEFTEGSYDSTSLGIGNNQLTSVKVPSGMQVTLYEAPGFKGRTKVLNGDTPYVGDFNDLTSAIKVEKVTTIYVDKDYGGRSKTLPVGSYNYPSLGIGNDKLSSLKVPAGLQATLYEHENFGGRSKVCTADTAWIGEDFNDLTSSIKIEKTPSSAVPTIERQPDTKYSEEVKADKITIGTDTPPAIDPADEAYKRLSEVLNRVGGN